MRKRILINSAKMIFLPVLAVVLTAGTALRTQAQRYHNDDEMDSGYYKICTANHLDESCWVREGSLMFYTEDEFSSRVGVDVSKWNAELDFQALRDQGVEFAIIRVGFRGYKTGEIEEDYRFCEYMDEAGAAGLDLGVYFFSQAIDEDEAVEEAQFVIDHIAGYTLSLPVYFDTEDVKEDEARTEVLAEANYNLNARAFCDTIESAGYRAGVYASSEWIRKNLDLAQLADYEIWYASYSNTPGRETGFDMWQYSASGDLEGSETYLDMNIRVEKEFQSVD